MTRCSVLKESYFQRLGLFYIDEGQHSFHHSSVKCKEAQNNVTKALPLQTITIRGSTIFSHNHPQSATKCPRKAQYARPEIQNAVATKATFKCAHVLI